MDCPMPSLESLISLAQGEFRTCYQGNNIQRLSFINFYENLADHLINDRELAQINWKEADEIQKLLTAALLFEYAWIWIIEYKGKSPEQSTSISNQLATFACNLFASEKREKVGSQLYTLIKTKFEDITDNAITYYSCLSAINQLYHYIAVHTYQGCLLSKNDVDQSKWKTKEILLEDLFLVLKKLKNKEWQRLTPEIQGLPKPCALQYNITEANENYRKIVASRSSISQFFTKKNHYEASLFVDFVNETCPCNSAYCDEDALSRIRAGAIFYVLLTIYNEYTVLSPRYGSDLFVQYLNALCIKGMWNTDLMLQADDLNALLAYISEIRHRKNYRELVDCWKERGLDLDSYLGQVIKNLPALQLQLQSPWWYETLLNYSVQYGAGATAVRYGLPLIGRLALGSLSGPAGVIFYIAGSTIFFTQLGIMVSKNVIPRAVMYVYGSILQKIGNKATQTASGMVKTANETLQSFWGYEELSQEDKDEIDEIINTLLSLPSGIVSDKEKEHLRLVFGFESLTTNTSISTTEIELDEYIEIATRNIRLAN